MKKFYCALFMVLTLCIGLLAGCSGNESAVSGSQVSIPAKPGAHSSTVSVAAADSVPEETDTAGEYDWWAKEWYGWWAIKNGTGIYQEPSDLNIVWDAYAEIQTNGEDLGHLTIWDTETSKSFALISGEVYFEPGGENGVMVLRSGTFFYGNTWLASFPVAQMPMEEDALSVDPENSTVSHFEEMIEIIGHYVSPENPDDSFDYYIYLRPWGTLWEDVRNGDTTGCLYSDMMPIYYDDWYVPLLNLGYEHPVSSFEEGIEILSGRMNGISADKAGADGIVDLETLKRCLPLCKTERTYSTTYEEIAAWFGVHGRPENSPFEGKSIYRWLADDNNYIEITFDIHEDGSETWNITQWRGIE